MRQNKNMISIYNDKLNEQLTTEFGNVSHKQPFKEEDASLRGFYAKDSNDN